MTQLDKLEKSNREQHEKLFNSIKELAIQIAEMPEKMTTKYDDKYAPIWAAKAWVWLMAVVGVMIVGAVIGQILITRVSAFFN